ncbi:similar to RIKEN cDNA 4933430F08 (predicted), isoform CRA_a [Rattus norvegicus]|uniref:Similar to RIKEN cDNA 4933430F08 (Predicted), isoform CRA_a n=1 Tax=Rattus norvegicus TaxID=10116 RepID=A6HZF1_RAT|nr:similar to RIKEN cDNA 4933430F08 (predicted), isoform CRA_a [Rattus norvegicus]EDM12581.1 similar to RIKEN cDNA 4933430F08 (predicted), isoform CRA_a [Rattus norvegicus]
MLYTSSTSPWRNKTTPFGRRSRPCSLSWQDGAGHCICMNDCAEWAVVHALLCCPLDAQSRPSNSQDNLPLMDTMAARNNCSRLLAPLPEPSSSLQAHAIMSLLASSLSPCPHCPRTLSW